MNPEVIHKVIARRLGAKDKRGKPLRDTRTAFANPPCCAFFGLCAKVMSTASNRFAIHLLLNETCRHGVRSTRPAVNSAQSTRTRPESTRTRPKSTRTEGVVNSDQTSRSTQTEPLGQLADQSQLGESQLGSD